MRPENPQEKESKDGVHEDERGNGPAKNRRKKRKAGADIEHPSKASRRSTRGAGKTISNEQLLPLLRYMLSEDAQELCRPQDESEDVASRDIKTFIGHEPVRRVTVRIDTIAANLAPPGHMVHPNSSQWPVLIQQRQSRAGRWRW